MALYSFSLSLITARFRHDVLNNKPHFIQTSTRGRSRLACFERARMAVPIVSKNMRTQHKVHSTRRWGAECNDRSRAELAIRSGEASFRDSSQRARELRYAITHFEILTCLRGARAKIISAQRYMPTFRQGNAALRCVIGPDLDIRLVDSTTHRHGPMKSEAAPPSQHNVVVADIPEMRRYEM